MDCDSKHFLQSIKAAGAGTLKNKTDIVDGKRDKLVAFILEDDDFSCPGCWDEALTIVANELTRVKALTAFVESSLLLQITQWTGNLHNASGDPS